MKQIIVTISILVLMIVAIFIIYYKNDVSKTIKVTTFEKGYNYVSKYHENEEVIIDIYLSSKNTYITNINNINECFIEDKNKENLIKLKLSNIINKNIVSLNNNTFYQYQFIFNIDIKTESFYEVLLSDAYLNINYLENDNIRIKIGSFSYYKIPHTNDENNFLSLSRVRAIVNEIDNIKTIVALDLGIKNNTNHDIEIIEIRPLDVSLQASYGDVINTEGLSYYPSDDLKSILGYEYSFSFNNDAQALSIELAKGCNLYYLFPLKYKFSYAINDVGFIIKYELDGQIYNFYFDDFIYFSNTNYNNDEINKLQYYIYENN